MGEKEFTSRLSGEMNPLQAPLATLADLGSGSHRPNPSQELWQSSEYKVAPITSPQPLFCYPRNKRKETQYSFQNHGTLCPLRQTETTVHFNFIRKETQRFIQSSAFYRKPTPQTQRNPTLQAVCIFCFHIQTYIYVHTHIYVCVGARGCIYSVWLFFFAWFAFIILQS